MQASAGFVSASALGIACGPALAGLLQMNFKIYKITFDKNTSPGWVMAVAWLFYLVWLWISFKEPACQTEEEHVPQESNSGKLTSIILLVNILNCNKISPLRIKETRLISLDVP